MNDTQPQKFYVRLDRTGTPRGVGTDPFPLMAECKGSDRLVVCEARFEFRRSDVAREPEAVTTATPGPEFVEEVRGLAVGVRRLAEAE